MRSEEECRGGRGRRRRVAMGGRGKVKGMEPSLVMVAMFFRHFE